MTKSKKILLVLTLCMALVLSMSAFAFASGTEETATVISAITDATSSLQGDAITIIGAAVGLGVVFWGAKLLWSKFKGMAK